MRNIRPESPVDRWNPLTGNATSIKSLDTTARTYQSPAAFERTIKKYIDTVADFDGARLGGDVIRPDEINIRSLDLAVQAGKPYLWQLEKLQELVRYAEANGVVMNIIEIP